MTVEPIAAGRPAPSLPLLFVEEMNHRVINEYAEAISALSLAARSAEPRAQAAIAKAADRLWAHAQAHRALAPPDGLSPTNLALYVGEVCRSLTKAALADRGARLTLRTEDIWVSPETAWRIGLIVAELVRNACRHGFSGRAGSIVVRLTERSGLISCLVADNGRGNAKPRPGRGTRLIRSIAGDLGGSAVWCFSSSGTLARLDVPNSESLQP